MEKNITQRTMISLKGIREVLKKLERGQKKNVSEDHTKIYSKSTRGKAGENLSK